LPFYGGAESGVSTNACLVRAAGGISDSLGLEEGLAVCQRVAADVGTRVGSKSSVGARRRNRDICRQDKESAIELLVPTIQVTRSV